MSKMTVIQLLNKIANGEEVPAKFRFAGQTFEKQGSYIEDEDGDSIFSSMLHDFSNINDEVEIIEENKKIEKYNTGLDNGNWNGESVKKEILKNNNIEDYLIRVMKDVDNIKFKTFEIIDYLNKEN